MSAHFFWRFLISSITRVNACLKACNFINKVFAAIKVKYDFLHYIRNLDYFAQWVRLLHCL